MQPSEPGDGQQDPWQHDLLHLQIEDHLNVFPLPSAAAPLMPQITAVPATLAAENEVAALKGAYSLAWPEI